MTRFAAGRRMIRLSLRLGRIVLLLAAAVLASIAVTLPGDYALKNWSGLELLFPMETAIVPQPRIPTTVEGLRAVDCEPYTGGLPDSLVRRVRSGDPGLSTYVCRFRFDRPHADVISQLPPFSKLLQIALGPGAPPSERIAWYSRPVLLGSGLVYHVAPELLALMLSLVLAWWSGLRPRVELSRLKAAFANANARQTGCMWSVIVGYHIAWGLARLLTGGGDWAALASIWWRAADTSRVLSNAIGSVFLAPITEEIIFRAWMIPLLSRAMSPHAAVWLAAAIFSCAHGFRDPFLLAHYLFVGALFGYFWMQTRSLLACVAAHAFLNFVPGVLRPLMMQFTAQ